MAKGLYAIEFDGTTFGMCIDVALDVYKKFKKHIVEEDAYTYFGDRFRTLAVPAVWLGAIMGEAHWLVTEGHFIDKFMIEGVHNGKFIYVKYDDEPLDLKKRRQKEHAHIYNYTRRN